MTTKVPEEIEALERQLMADPDPRLLLEQLLYAYFDEGLRTHPRRFDHILCQVRKFPRSGLSRCPFAHIDPRTSPEGYRAVEREWIRLFDENPNDPDIARGLALFIECSDRERALDILERIVRQDPSQAEVWMELGRISPEPSERLRFLQEARRRGSSQPNLLVWIGRTATEIEDFTTAEIIGRELLSLVDAARAVHGERLDWTETGRQLWDKARDAAESESEALQFVDAHSDHAHRKHWGHTILGLVALHRGDIAEAVDHLRKSSAVPGESRLSSYGPSFRLAGELCGKGEWSAVAEYLQACEAFWDIEQLRACRIEVERRQIPEFPDT
jgi:tetratricopeptide (TPR) repeat protein